MGERPEPLVESLREASCRAWKSFSNGSSLLPECRECPSFVLNALLETSGFLFKWSQNHWRLSNPANVLPNRSTNDFGSMLSPPSTQMPLSRLASDGWQTRGATMWRVRRYSAMGKRRGAVGAAFFRHCSANMSKHSKGGRTQNPETIVMAAVKFAVLPPLGGWEVCSQKAMETITYLMCSSM